MVFVHHGVGDAHHGGVVYQVDLDVYRLRSEKTHAESEDVYKPQ